eukprot:5276372-Prymnesium_polylepis.1
MRRRALSPQALLAEQLKVEGAHLRVLDRLGIRRLVGVGLGVDLVGALEERLLSEGAAAVGR